MNKNSEKTYIPTRIYLIGTEHYLKLQSLYKMLSYNYSGYMTVMLFIYYLIQ